MMHTNDENHRYYHPISHPTNTGSSTTNTTPHHEREFVSGIVTRPTCAIPSVEGMLSEHNNNLFDTFLKATNACDKFFNCAYVTKQLEDEWHQERNNSIEMQENGSSTMAMTTTTMTTKSGTAMDRVWNKMEKSFQVEVYRQFLFDESSFDDNSDGDDDDHFGHGGNRLASLLHYCGNENDVSSIPDLTRSRS